eukprot:9148846-Pyramimonas_sp.AAC.2
MIYATPPVLNVNCFDCCASNTGSKTDCSQGYGSYQAELRCHASLPQSQRFFHSNPSAEKRQAHPRSPCTPQSDERVYAFDFLRVAVHPTADGKAYVP